MAWGAKAHDRFEPERFVAVIVSGIARFEIGRHSLGVDAREVLAEKRYAEAAAAMFIPRSQQTEIIVRLVVPVRVVEAVEQLGNLRCSRADESVQHAGEALLAPWENSFADGGIHTETVSKPLVFKVQG